MKGRGVLVDFIPVEPSTTFCCGEDEFLTGVAMTTMTGPSAVSATVEYTGNTGPSSMGAAVVEEGRSTSVDGSTSTAPSSSPTRFMATVGLGSALMLSVEGLCSAA